ncbi:MAG: DUF3616 domain-containing protein [Desulfobulbaceae bacterium]|nr:DUF3616 domain-containing protein [Desulfobulbaceae bacterium]
MESNIPKIVFTIIFLVLFFLSSVALCAPPQMAKLIESWELLSFPTGNNEHMNISGLTMVAGSGGMVVGADELSHIHILQRIDGKTFKLMEDGTIPLSPGETELDIEGVAGFDNFIWVIGSHSLSRKSIRTPQELKGKADKKKKNGKSLSRSYNRDRFETIKVEPSREWLYRLEVKDNGAVERGTIVRGSLRDIFANHPVLSRFCNIPSKENGLDIEGLAVVQKKRKKSSHLLVGLRGPVLQGAFAVVLKVSVKDGTGMSNKPILDVKLKDTYYLSLDGRGIRGMSSMGSKAGDGYLILAGPVGGAPVSYTLYHWNGADTIPEIDSLDAQQNLTELCQIPVTDAALRGKPEGVHFLSEENGVVSFLIVYDSVANGAPGLFTCRLDGSVVK